jgi:Domain of unknown function (DUF1963)
MAASTPSGVLISPVYPADSNHLDQFSHLGGLPGLPQGLDWPRTPNGTALHLLAQIDLAAMPPGGIVDFQGRPLPEFPRTGALYFFADCATFGIWEHPEAAHRVLYSLSYQGLRPVPPPDDLAPHNAPDAPVLANTHHPYFPRLRPRPIVLLPHVPISLTEMPSTVDAPTGDPPRSWYLNGYDWRDGDWSRAPLFDTGFPWRWLFLERIAVSVDKEIRPDWPEDIRQTCVSWFQRASIERPTDRIPQALVADFCNWLRSLATRDQTIRYYVGGSIPQAITAAWPYVGFSGDLSDFPDGLVQDHRPLVRPMDGSYHKMFGDAMSVQHVQLADDDNVLLLRLDSDYPLDFCWGDVGVLQITMSRNDLLARNFEHTALNADCT